MGCEMVCEGGYSCEAVVLTSRLFGVGEGAWCLRHLILAGWRWRVYADNKIGDPGATEVAGALRANAILTSLILHSE